MKKYKMSHIYTTSHYFDVEACCLEKAFEKAKKVEVRSEDLPLVEFDETIAVEVEYESGDVTEIMRGTEILEPKKMDPKDSGLLLVEGRICRHMK